MSSEAKDEGGVGESTAARLLAAAMAEFNAHGFAGTDTTRIARRAGCAPQTFYRWYPDKTAIFLAGYAAWQVEEAKTLGALMAQDAAAETLADAVVEHHRRHLLFRRSLRRLSLEDPQVRKVRAESRLRQIAQVRRVQAGTDPGADALAVTLLQLERLADALAEGELTDMGLDTGAARTRLGQLISDLRGG